ncbi:protein kinase domain-containing protein [Haliangium sp.]|uniref:protein kinase domain-containing protein n=1 Tax=Haliangium sp. TaxID=2663208 RepID=UPI003D0F7289
MTDRSPSLPADGQSDQAKRSAARIRKESVRAALFKKPQTLHIGRFTLLDRLGAGAMGEVYSAYDAQLDRKVALKLVRAEAKQNARADARLLREAQTLAQLSHPHVVQVYEAGTYDGGVFVAMEFIRGKTLTQWIGELDPELSRTQRRREVLRQFIAAGRGLEAAHAAGLAHRDFKPDNVLCGDDGRVRVVDFGLARAVADVSSDDNSRDEPGERSAPARTEPRPSPRPESYADIKLNLAGTTMDLGPADQGAPADLPAESESSARRRAATGPTMPLELDEISADSTSDRGNQLHHSGDQRKAAVQLTATGMVMGTPRYMPPEQFRGQMADHRSDQFSFCVSLFKALCDDWPFQGDTLPALIQAVSAGDLTLPRRFGELPAPVRKALLRGLSSDPEDRFPDMGALLRELEAWPERRKRVALGLAGVALTGAVAAGFALIPSAQDPCAEVGSKLDSLWNRQRRTAIATVFADTGLSYAGAMWNQTADWIERYVGDWRTTARTICEDPLRRELPEHRLCLEQSRVYLAALLRSFDGGDGAVDASVVDNALSVAAELPDPRECVDADTRNLGMAPPPPGQAGAVRSARERLAEAHTHTLFGRYQQALEMYDGLEPEVEGIEYAPLRAELLYRRGRALADRRASDDLDHAFKLYMDVLDIAEAQHHDVLAAETWRDLMLLTLVTGTYEAFGGDPLLWWRRARAAVIRIGDRPRDRAATFRARALIYQKVAKDYDEAERAYREAISTLEDDPRLRALLAATYHDFANSQKWRGAYADADELFRRALSLLREQLGPDHPLVASALYDQGRMLLDLGDLAGARVALEGALEIWRRTLDEHHARLRRVHLLLAGLEARSGAFDKAREHAARAEEIIERGYGPGDVRRGEVGYARGTIGLYERDFAAARDGFAAALDIRRAHNPDTNTNVIWTRMFLADSLVSLERFDEANEQCRVVRQREDLLSGDLLAFTLGVCARARLEVGPIGRPKQRSATALAELERSVAVLLDDKPRGLDEAAHAWALARALWPRRRPGEPDQRGKARALAEQARAMYLARGPVWRIEREAIDEWLGERD